MLNQLRTFFNHSRHKLSVLNLDAQLDVLAFEGEEHLSQPFNYCIEFTCVEQDIAAEQILGKGASFSLHPLPLKRPVLDYKFDPVPVLPLRTLHGVITGFKRLSASKDEARYEVTLEPRLALLGRGKQTRIYQDQSVPEIVKSIFLGRHGFWDYEIVFKLVHEYPKRKQVMQYAESDLAFVSRLLAEVGIWYRVSSNDVSRSDVVECHDHRQFYQFDVQLPCRPLSGLSSNEASVWGLQTEHQVVEKNINFRAYNHLDASAWLNGEVDHSRRATTTYGEAYLHAEPYTVLDDPLALDEDLICESGYFYARLHHERYLNGQTRLSGFSSSGTLAPGQVLNISGGAPQAFKPGAVIIGLTTRAARDASFEADFTAIPYTDHVCFRPPLLDKPKMAGTLPARVTSNKENDPYSHINLDGKYRVQFNFDRDVWKLGQESLWMRMARSYAGDTHGLHLPLVAGTEVAIAFEQGNPDRPYIAHALHDNKRPDHVTMNRRDFTRNVLRTPANNKLRMEDLRGQEHIKLSTEHSGKSQLNLGHLVDAEKKKRGEGFELRTDGWGAIRGGKGLFISADEQAKATGHVLTMEPASNLVQGAKQQIADWQNITQAHHSRQPAIEGLSQFQTDAKDLKGQAILLSAPNGIGAVTPASLLLKSGDAMYLQSSDDIHLAAAQRLSAHANQSISLLAQQEGLRLVSGKGPLEIESHGDLLNLIAQQDITVQSTQGQLHLTAKNGITLGCGGGFIRINPSGEIDIHTPGKLNLKGLHAWEYPAGQSFPLIELPQSVCEECVKIAQVETAGAVMRVAGGGQ